MLSLSRKSRKRTEVMVNILVGETARNIVVEVEIGTATDTVTTAAAIAVTAAALGVIAAAIDMTVGKLLETVVTDAMVGMIAVTTIATGIKGEIVTGETGIGKVEETETKIATAEEIAITETETAIPRDMIGEKVTAVVTRVIPMIPENGAVKDAVQNMKILIVMNMVQRVIA